MDTNTYGTVMEKKMITQFKTEFYNKIGYYPVVLTFLETDDDKLPVLPLNKLKDHFDEFLPQQYGETLTLCGKVRKREIVELRCIYCYLAKSMGYSLNDIGKEIGGRDHTTVIHSLKTFRDLMEISDIFRQKYDYVFSRIKNKFKSKIYESPTLDGLNQAQYQSKSTVLS